MKTRVMRTDSLYLWEKCNENVIEVTRRGLAYRHHKCKGSWRDVVFGGRWWLDHATHVVKITYHQAIMWLAFDEEMPKE
jgi:hypothetical protein